MLPASLVGGNQKLVQIVNAALADSVRRSGDWLACKPGCSQCCMGVFAINQLDAARLKGGLKELEARDPERAARIRERAQAAVERLTPTFPGDAKSGILEESPKPPELWNDFGNDEPCPVLDPVTGTCELYEVRPMTCRVFGPPIMDEGELGVCELCYDGVSDEKIAECEMRPDPENLEGALVKQLEDEHGLGGKTIIAFALGKT